MRAWPYLMCCGLIACTDDAPERESMSNLAPEVEYPPDPEGAVSADPPPPAIQGGTLLITSGGLAVASDPDRDMVFVVHLDNAALTATIVLEPGDEPGRLVEDGRGDVHVALRRGGAIVTIDPHTGEVLARHAICSAPSGIAYESATDLLHVACETGELVSMSPSGVVARSLQLDPDLRDVVSYSDDLYVSRFRSAEVLTLDAAGNVRKRATPLLNLPPELQRAPHVAWQMREVPGYGVHVLHQFHREQSVLPEPGGYAGGDDCDGLVVAALTRVDSADPRSELLPGTLVVDFASGDAGAFATVSTGHGFDHGFLFDILLGNVGVASCSPFDETISFHDQFQVTAVALDASGALVAQSRQPAVLLHQVGNDTRVIALSDVDRRDSGHALFHAATGVNLACASCHPAGREDGHVWNFEGVGPRRTQALGGTLSATAPYHWDGAMVDLQDIMSEVLQERMCGPFLEEDAKEAFASWLFSLPRPAQRVGDPVLVAQGRAIFEDEEVGCTTCHAGEMLTNNQTVEVGTGAALQVPSLIGLGRRAPYMHDGCADTLDDRFDSWCGGDAHGQTQQLLPGERAALVAYLETL